MNQNRGFSSAPAPFIANDKGFRFFCAEKKFFDSYPQIFEKIKNRDGIVLADKMYEPKRKRIVLKTTFENRTVVLKHEFFVFRFDRSIKAFLFGSDARNIFKVGLRAQKHKFDKIPRIYMVAEKFSGGILRESITVMEFLEGATLPEPLSEAQKSEVAALMESCHALDIISGDIQFGNFISTKDGIKLIDFRGNKVLPGVAKARDRIQLEHKFKIENKLHDFSEKFFFFLGSLRNLSRTLRKKPPHQD